MCQKFLPWWADYRSPSYPALLPPPIAQKLSQKQKVAIGSLTFLGLCGIPVFAKDEKRGHDLFSQERPEAVVQSQEKALKDFDKRSIAARKSS